MKFNPFEDLKKPTLVGFFFFKARHEGFFYA